MKFVFYFPFDVSAAARPSAILVGNAPASGTQSSIRLGLALRSLGHEVEVIHHISGEQNQAEGIALIYAEDPGSAALRIVSLPADSTVILPPANALAMLYAIRASRLRKLVWLHNNCAIDWLEMAFRLGTDRAVCVSQTASLMYRAYPFRDRVEVVSYSLRDSASFPEPQPLPGRVAFVGALTESKGFHHVLAAWPAVRRLFADAHLDVFGSCGLHFSGPTGSTGLMTAEFENRWWQPLMHLMGGSEQAGITLHGAISKDRLFAGVSSARVGIVNPNLTGSTETFCLSAIEMQACGVPCIGGGVGGLLDTISNGISGFHLRSQRPEELATRIAKVLSDAELQQRLSAGARAFSSRFLSPEREARQFEQIIQRVRQNTPAPRQGRYLGDLLWACGFGRAKLALKRMLRPEVSADIYRAGAR